MGLGKFAFNVTTSVIFGPAKYGYKLLAEPENKKRNLAFLGMSMVPGLVIMNDVVEAAIESGSESMDGIDAIETRNDHLSGSFHPETGVGFNEQVVEVDGEEVVGVFPDFESHFNVTVPQIDLLASDQSQFMFANLMLLNHIMQDSSMIGELGLSEEGFMGLRNGITPEGYTWHHSEQPGVLQLVNSDVHANTGHTGGRELWGGGSLHR